MVRKIIGLISLLLINIIVVVQACVKTPECIQICSFIILVIALIDCVALSTIKVEE